MNKPGWRLKSCLRSSWKARFGDPTRLFCWSTIQISGAQSHCRPKTTCWATNDVIYLCLLGLMKRLSRWVGLSVNRQTTWIVKYWIILWSVAVLVTRFKWYLGSKEPVWFVRVPSKQRCCDACVPFDPVAPFVVYIWLTCVQVMGVGRSFQNKEALVQTGKRNKISKLVGGSVGLLGEDAEAPYAAPPIMTSFHWKQWRDTSCTNSWNWLSSVRLQFGSDLQFFLVTCAVM